MKDTANSCELQTDNMLISPSGIARFLTCPEKYNLSKKHPTDSTEAMRNGSLFEGYLLGFESAEKQKSLEGRKKAETLDFMRNQASHCKPIFKSGDNQKAIQTNISKGFILRGICDYIGEVDTVELSKLCGVDIDPYLSTAIVDIKYTGNISRVWDEKDEAEELLQSICYPYIHWKNHGEILPFFYFIVDSEYERPIVRVLNVEVSEYDFRFIDGLIYKIASPFGHKPNITDDTCGGRRMSQSKCQYLQYCEYGRAFIGGCKTVKFER